VPEKVIGIVVLVLINPIAVYCPAEATAREGQAGKSGGDISPDCSPEIFIS
jgi:hypothetical protein